MNAPRIPSRQRRRAWSALARLPVFFALAGKRAVVAGGTPAAAWKAELLSAAGAEVDVFADEVLGRDCWRWRRDPPAWRDRASSARLDRPRSCRRRARDRRVRATTSEAARFAAAARAAGVPVNVIDKPAFCDFSFGSIVNRSPLVIGISTDGAAPVFAQAIRAKLEALIPRGFARWAEAARRWRDAVKSSGLPFAGRRRFWQMFTATALREPDREPAPADFDRLLAETQAEARAARQPARSRWSAPAPAIRSC